MYKKINITENHLRILSLFTNGYGRECYIREAARLAQLSPRAAQLILDDLEKKAVLESEARGKIKAYRIKASDSSRQYFKLAEHYKLITFLSEEPVIAEIVSKLAPSIKGIAAVFGSYAKKTHNQDSDLDIFITGEYSSAELQRLSKIYKIDINPKRCTLETFASQARDDTLIKEVVLNHIVISRTEEFVDGIWQQIVR
jgi:uncharacterized protein